MSFSYLIGRGSLGSWAIGTTVAPSEFWWIEDCITKTIDAYAGCTVAPSAPIIIGGSGLQVTGIMVVSGQANFNGNVNLYGPFTTIGNAAADVIGIRGTSTFYEPVTISTTLTCSGNVTLGASNTQVLTVPAESFFTADVQFDNPVVCTDALTCQGNVTLGNAPTDDIETNGSFTKPIRLSEAAYIKKRRIRIVSGGAGQTVSLEFYDQVFIYIAGDLLLSKYGEDGGEIRISNDSSGTVTVKDEISAATIVSLASKTWADIMYDPTGIVGAWRISASGALP